MANSDHVFVEVFGRLRGIVASCCGSLKVESDTSTSYILTGPMMPRWKKELWFGGVKLGKSYVSLHLMPVYMFPDLLGSVSPKLRSRMQGKSCFNFKRVDEELFSEVTELVLTCMKRLDKEGLL